MAEQEELKRIAEAVERQNELLATIAGCLFQMAGDSDEGEDEPVARYLNGKPKAN